MKNFKRKYNLEKIAYCIFEMKIYTVNPSKFYINFLTLKKINNNNNSQYCIFKEPSLQFCKKIFWVDDSVRLLLGCKLFM